jgi:hypothetical protein
LANMSGLLQKRQEQPRFIFDEGIAATSPETP